MKKQMYVLLSVIFIGLCSLGASVFVFTTQLSNTLTTKTKSTSDSFNYFSTLNESLLLVQNKVALAHLRLKVSDIEEDEKKISELFASIDQQVETIANLNLEWMSLETATFKKNDEELTQPVVEIIRNMKSSIADLYSDQKNLLEARKKWVTENETLAASSKELSKIYRDSFTLRKYNEEHFQNLGRAVITVLSSKSVRDLQFAGRTIFASVDEEYKKLPMTTAHKEMYTKLSQAFQNNLLLATTVYASSGDFDIFNAKLTDTISPITASQATAKSLFEQGQNHAVNLADKTRWTSLFSSAGILVVCLGIGLAITINLTRKMYQFSESLNQSVNSTSEIGNQLADQSQQLASRSTEQATSMEEVSSSLEEVSGMVAATVRSSQDSLELSKKVTELVTLGVESMNDLQVSVHEISENNIRVENLAKLIEEIGSKTELIDDIVFQTRLLSFNASVEAERAGEHGRGFAVVAQEVGNLAQMSGKSASEISTIVKQSIKEATEVVRSSREKITKGVTLCKSTSHQLHEINQASKEILKSCEAILTASQEQNTGIRVINESIQTISDSTQGNAVTARDCSKSSESLNEQSSALESVATNLAILINGKAGKQDTHSNSNAA